MKKKPQIFLVHGGMTFKSNKDYLHYLKTREIKIQKKASWSADYFDKELGRKFDIIRPRMPLSENAKYRDWKIYFERHIPFLRNGVILIGSSLGGIFLAKYLSEHKFPKKISAIFLVCPPFDNTIPNEDLVSGFRLKSDLSMLEKNSKNLYLMFSEDDEVVPVSQAEKYRKKLDKANILIYKGKNGHFDVTKFSEIVKIIKDLFSR